MPPCRRMISAQMARPRPVPPERAEPSKGRNRFWRRARRQARAGIGEADLDCRRAGLHHPLRAHRKSPRLRWRLAHGSTGIPRQIDEDPRCLFTIGDERQIDRDIDGESHRRPGSALAGGAPPGHAGDPDRCHARGRADRVSSPMTGASAKRTGAWLGLFGLAEGHRRLAEIDGALECIDEARGQISCTSGSEAPAIRSESNCAAVSMLRSSLIDTRDP